MASWVVNISVPANDTDRLEHDMPGAGGVVGATALDPDADDPSRAMLTVGVEASSREEARGLAIQRYAAVKGWDGRIEDVSPG